ncbi:DUF4114 domain-containing protein [Corallococcus carmarthensis]|uniref:DUF4114 domain-containing protein n=1 Tax=Corallococcus carmarthensis TaxID=2316728 RepID=A0A3A8K479_9BACT|nr:DUF4114 domain-containing protein [Corallococcus carmarthensis]RKH01969.1 DUF4114 domain-containing protein [Corallococcus carmarthensis]
MSPNPSRFLALVAGSALLVIPSVRLAHAADSCTSGGLYLDVQPEFTAAGFDLLQQVTLTPLQALRPDAPWLPPSAEQFVLPSDQRISISYLYESSGASHSLGYLYVDELQARGYVNAQGDLVDANGNGIADLHEDLYNLAPATGAQARPYVGLTRRCTNTFTSGGFTYSQPALALSASCSSAFNASRALADARPGSHPVVNIDLVGTAPTGAPGNGYSDNGLFPRLPNLLEPAHASNGNKGLGHLVFLLADDDSDTDTFQSMGTVSDGSSLNDGVPDYDVSAYDAHGLPRATNPDPGITQADRTVDLGVIQGGRELVFFLVTTYAMSHNMDEGTVYPCLRKAANGQCTLHLKTPVSVFFSKSKWNLDQDPVGQAPVASRNIGCSYDASCNPTAPASSPSACTVASSSQKLCGWLDSDARLRLNTPAYGNLPLPREATTVLPSGNGNMPHLLMGLPSTSPRQWVLGFEDLSGGGDRDFNDVVFRVSTAPMPSIARSTVLSPDAPGCALSQVMLRKDQTLGIPGCDAYASITYAVATDCRTCTSGLCFFNPTPTWRPVTFSGSSPSAILDVSSTPGHQLCWKAEFTSSMPTYCEPTLNNLDVGYEAVPVAD